MSTALFALGLILGFIGVLVFLGGSGFAAIQGGMLVIVSTLLIVGAAILEKLDVLRRDIGLAAAEAVKALLEGVKEK